MTVEDRLRATTEAVTESMRPVRPLVLPPAASGARSAAKPGRARPARRWPSWLVPLAAAMAVMAVAATLVAVRNLTGGGLASPSTRATTSTATPPLSSAVPRYYVDFGPLGRNGAPTQNAVLADLSTGKQLATFTPPLNDMFLYTAAAADDKTFVLLATPSPVARASKAGQSDSWYVLHLPPGAPQRARLTRVPIAALPADTSVIGLAVSPDGLTLAVLFQVVSHVGGTGKLAYGVMMRTYTLATGQELRTWTDPTGALSPTGPGTFNISWLDDGRTLAFASATRAAPQGIRFLNTTSPGTNLISNSRLVFSAPADDACGSVLLTLDGKAVICGGGATGNGSCANGQVDVTAYSVATGKLERVLYRYQGSCQPVGLINVMWAESGALAIGALFVGSAKLNRVGIMSAGKLTPLPILSNGDAYGAGSIAF